MPLFDPDFCLPRDPAGFGQWRRGHYDEHRQFITLSALLSPVLVVPDFDLGYWSDDPAVVKSWLNYHSQVHNVLEARANIGSIDLSAVDLTDNDEWNEWMDDHRQAHALLRTFFGVH